MPHIDWSRLLSCCATVALAAGLSACTGDDSGETIVVADTGPGSETGSPSGGESEATFEPESPGEPSTETAETSPAGSGTIATPGETEMRARRRMDIDQLDASLRRVTGGIGWQYESDGQVHHVFDQLSETLGKPDFADSTKETLSPTPVFQKFLGDAARSVCRKLTARELKWDRAGSHEDQRRLFIHARHTDTYKTAPDEIDKNLQALLLNFHGRRVGLDSPTLANWRSLFQKANARAAKPHVAWRTVCVTLIQHPDFYTF